MRIRILSVILLLAILASCNSGDNQKGSEEKLGFITKSWNSVKNGVKVPFEYWEERNRKADSTEQIAIANHFQKLREEFPEYRAAEKWFQSEPEELLGMKGNFYKINEGTVQNGRSLKRSNFVEPVGGNIYKYFFETQDRFYILELEIGNKVICRSVRCILNGWGKQPMFDYKYDDKGNLVEEVFQADVEPSVYEEDGKLFFEYAKGELVNTIQLGPTIEK